VKVWRFIVLAGPQANVYMLQVHSKAKQYRFSTLPLYAELHGLFCDTAATGSLALSSIAPGPASASAPAAESITGDFDEIIATAAEDLSDAYSSDDNISAELQDESDVDSPAPLKKITRHRPPTPNQKKARPAATPTPSKAKSSAKRGRTTTPSKSPGDMTLPVRERPSGASRIADAIQSIATAVIPSVHERAIEALNQHYSTCLTDLQMVQAYSLMADKSKASVFVAMPTNRCRKLWLYGEIGAEIGNI
jgi:hypothetical protein